jgi:glycosyltransferase involved in cell wall biosynthesis
VQKITVCYMVIQLETGGAERQLVVLLEGLDRSRYRPFVVVERLGGALEPSVRKLGIPIHVVPRRSRRDPLFPFRLARLLRRERVDVVHPVESMLDVYGVLAGVVARVPVRLMTWRTLHYRWWHTVLLWLTLPLAHRLIANSEHAARWLRRWFRPRSRVIAIPNGLDCERFAHAPTLDEKRRALGLADDAGPLIGMVARLRPDKDFETLFDAARRLRARFPKLTVLVVGSGPRLGELEAAASRLLPPGGCRFLGQRHDVHELYHLFDVSVLATEYEGMPNVVMEAMAAGRPVVATAVAGCSELIANGATGILVPPHDAEALAGAIARLLDDGALARQLGKAAQQHVREHYSLERLVERHEHLYESLLARKRPTKHAAGSTQ